MTCLIDLNDPMAEGNPASAGWPVSRMANWTDQGWWTDQIDSAIADPDPARWLKLHAIRWAYEKGVAELRTTNDAPNIAIRALNADLGFVPTSTELRLRAALGPDVRGEG